MNRFTAAIKYLFTGKGLVEYIHVTKEVIKNNDRYFLGDAVFTDLFVAHLATGEVETKTDSSYDSKVKYDQAVVKPKYFLTCNAAHEAAENQPWPKTHLRYSTRNDSVKKIKAIKIDGSYLIVPDSGYKLVIAEDSKGKCCTS